MTVKEFLRDTYKDERYIFRPHVVCADGYQVSIQAGSGLYSCPRENVLEYTAVELGFPNMADELIMEYIDCPDDDPTKTVMVMCQLILFSSLWINMVGLLSY